MKAIIEVRVGKELRVEVKVLRRHHYTPLYNDQSYGWGYGKAEKTP